MHQIKSRGTADFLGVQYICSVDHAPSWFCSRSRMDVTLLCYSSFCIVTLVLPSGALHCVPLASTTAVRRTKCIPITELPFLAVLRKQWHKCSLFYDSMHLAWLCQYLSSSQTKVKLSPFSLQMAGHHWLLCPWIKITKTCWIIQHSFFQPSCDGTLYCCFSECFPDCCPAVLSTATVLIHVCILLSEWQCILDTTYLQLGSSPQSVPAARAP